MPLKPFLFFIFSSNKKPLYIDNGMIVEGTEDLLRADGQPADLEYAPIGWKDTLVKYARNIKYWGTLRDMTVPMSFAKDGYKILKYLLSTRGTETIAPFGIAKWDRFTLPYNYENWYLSEIDFTKYEQKQDSFEVSAMSGGLAKLFKSFENTKFEISVEDDPTKQTVLLDGIRLTMSQQYEYLDSDFGGPEGLTMPAFTIPIFGLEPDGRAPYLVLKEQYQEVALPIDDPDNPNIYGFLIESENYFAKLQENAPSNVDLRLEGRFSINMKHLGDNNSPIRVRFWQIKPGMTIGSGPDQLNLTKAVNIFYGAVLEYAPRMKDFDTGLTTYEIFFDKTLTLEPGDKVFYTCEYYPLYDDEYSLLAFSSSSTLKASFATQYAATYCEGLYIWRVFEKLIDKLIENQFLTPVTGSRLKSVYLYGKQDLVITSGDLLRRIPGGVIKTSLSQAIQAMQHYSIGMATDSEYMYIEPLKAFFRDDIMLSLGEVSNPTLKQSTDLMFNTFKVGGPELDYEFVNGKFEPNQLQTWKMPITKNIVEYDLSSEWRRDPYGVEDLRINNAGKVTTDSSGDNDVFMLSVEPAVVPGVDGAPAHHKLYRPFGVITGVPDPAGIFNMDLTPKRSIVNNMPLLSSIADKLEDRYIDFGTTTKNRDLVAYGLDEDAAVQAGSGAKLFLPHYFTFVTKVPLNLTEILGNQPYGKVEFTVLGRPFRGYLFDGGVKPADNDKQTWILLASPDNDLSKFYEPL